LRAKAGWSANTTRRVRPESKSTGSRKTTRPLHRSVTSKARLINFNANRPPGPYGGFVKMS